MAIGVFTLTRRQRECLSIILVTLSILQVASGVVILSLSVFTYVRVAPVVYSERAELSFVFVVIGICGLNNICCYLYGFKIRFKCLKQAYKKSTRTLVFVWTCVCFYITINLAILGRIAKKVYKHIIRSMGHSIQIGISKYLREETWKVTIDRIQYDLQCCGAHSYKEWHQTNWLNKYHVNINSESVKQFRDNITSTLPITPWSCCRITFPLQCLHDPLQQSRSLNVWADQPALVLESLNTEGCLTKLKVPIRTALTTFILLVVLVVFVQIIMFFILRLLYTSCRNAEILNKTNGAAPGWIFGRGDCGYNRGKTLGELVRQRSKEIIEEEQLLDTHEKENVN